MRKGDLVFANQSGPGLVGVTRLKTNGYRSARARPYDIFDLDPRAKLRFEHPIPFSVIRELRGAEKEIEAVRTWRPTVREITPRGVELLVRAIGEANPSQREGVRRFARMRSR